MGGAVELEIFKLKIPLNDFKHVLLRLCKLRGYRKAKYKEKILTIANGSVEILPSSSEPKI